MNNLRLLRLGLFLGSIFMLFLLILYWDKVENTKLHLFTSSPPAPPPPLAAHHALHMPRSLIVTNSTPLPAATVTAADATTSTQLMWTSEDKGYAFVWDTDAFDLEVMADPDPPETRPTNKFLKGERLPQQPIAKPPEAESPQLNRSPGREVTSKTKEMFTFPEVRTSLPSTTTTTITTNPVMNTGTTTDVTTIPTTSPTTIPLASTTSTTKVSIPTTNATISATTTTTSSPSTSTTSTTTVMSAPISNHTTPRKSPLYAQRPPVAPPTPAFLNLLRRQAERRRHLQQACAADSTLDFPGKRRSFNQIPSQALDHLIVDDRHGVIYCYVPKVACTNWKRVMIVLGEKVAPGNNGQDKARAGGAAPTPFRRPQDVPSELSHNGTLHLTFNKFWRRYGRTSRSLMRAKLRKYTKFLFVRDPFVRLMSAFRNKLAQPNEDFYRQFGARMLQRYANITRPPPTAQEAFRVGQRPNFSHFVRYLLDPETERGSDGGSGEPFNEHWRQIYRLCHPCQIEYDFIGKLETLDEDARHLLNILGVDQKIQFPPGYRNRTAASWERDWFAGVSIEDRQKLYELYKPDFQLFGYSKPESLLTG